jgi:hypothetical protein
VLTLVKDWAPALRAVIVRGDPVGWTAHPVKSLFPDRSWHSDHVTLLGDAVRVMSLADEAPAQRLKMPPIWPRILVECGELETGPMACAGMKAKCEAGGFEAVQQSLEGSGRLSRAKAA